MKAVVYRGEGQVAVEEVLDPVLQAPDDALVRVHTAAICGSDLHILHGRVPGVFEGATVGHEFTGQIVEAGSDVRDFIAGDEVIGSFQISCGACDGCRRGHYNHCVEMGTLGYGIFVGDLGGSQAELVRVPHADVNLMRKPTELSHEQALFVGDILTTGWYCASLGDIHPGDTVVVVGAGPVGVFSAMSAQAMGAGRLIVTDLVGSRLGFVREQLGADTIDAAKQSVSVALDALAPGGADVVLETVGLPPALITAIDCVKTGGTVAVIGVHTEFEMALPVGNLFTRNITLRFGGSCNVQGVWEQTLRAVQDGRIDPTRIISHRLRLADAVEGYRLFDAKEALKVVLEVG